jgi:hypothetical protein
MNQNRLYDDGQIACEDTSLLVRRYYFPWGSKRIRYASIKNVRRLPIGVRRWRIWGSGDFRHWWHLDLKRPTKNFALELDTGRRILPMITPADVDAVEAIIKDRSARPH